MEVPNTLKSGIVAILIQHGHGEETCISFNLRKRMLTVHRSNSSHLDDVSTADHSAYIPKFLEHVSNEDNVERFDLKVLVDQSLLEVVACDGVVSLSTRIYPKCWSEGKSHPEIYLMSSNEKMRVTQACMWWRLPEISE